MARGRLSGSTRNSTLRRRSGLVSALVGVMALVAAIAVTGTPAWAADPIAIGTIEGQIGGLLPGSSACSRYFPNSGTTQFQNGPTEWVTNPTEALGSHGYPINGNCNQVQNTFASVTSQASVVGLIPSAVTSVTPGSNFLVGAVRHHNNPINITAGVDYSGQLLFEFPALSATFTVPWSLWETPNDDTTCANGEANNQGININGCADRIQFGSQIADQIVDIDGMDYRLVFDGFSPSVTGSCPAEKPEGTQNVFWTVESANTTSCLYASLQQIRHLTVVKEVSPPVTGAPSFSFASTSSLAGSPWEGQSFSLNDGGSKGESLFEGTVTVNETEPPGWTLTKLQCTYDSGEQLSSTDAAAINVSGTTLTIAKLPVNTTQGQQGITCTFTNARAKTQLTLTKTWVEADTGDTADLFITSTDGQLSGSGSATATVPAGGTGEAAQTVTVDAYAGDTLTLGETLADGNIGLYTSSIVCDPANGFDPDSAGMSGTLIVPNLSDLAPDTTCTVNNSSSSASVTLHKSWVDGAEGDSAELSINSEARTRADVPVGGNGTSDGTATMMVPSGSRVVVSEVLPFPGITNASSYTVTSLVCVDTATDNPVSVTWTEGGHTGSFNAPGPASESERVTCTFTNARAQASLTLQKVWVNGAEGDTIALAAGPATGSSTSGGQSGSWIDSGSAVTTPVFSGDQIDVSEVLGAENVGSYAPTLTCDEDGLGDTSATTDGINGTYTMPLTAADVTCQVTNTRTSATITLQKQWTNGVKGDTADLSLESDGLSGPGAVASTVATDAFSGTQNGDSTRVTMYSGDMLTLTETLGAGNTGTYTTMLACGGEKVVLDSALSAMFDAPVVDTTCTYLNASPPAEPEIAYTGVNTAGMGWLVLLLLTGGALLVTGGTIWRRRLRRL